MPVIHVMHVLYVMHVMNDTQAFKSVHNAEYCHVIQCNILM